MSWHIKLPLLLVIFATAPLAMTAAWTFDLIEETYETSTIESLQALASARAAAIQQFTEDRENQVERIAQLLAPEVKALGEAKNTLSALENAPPQPLPELKDADELPRSKAEAKKDEAAAESVEQSSKAEEEEAPAPQLAAPTKAVEEALTGLRQKLSLLLWDQAKFEEFLVMAADGQVLVSTFAEHEGRNAAEVAYFKSGLGTTYVQPVFKSPITDRLTMVIATPIRNEDAEVMGVLAARLNLSRFFRLINDFAGLGKTGETVVGKRIDDSVLMMAPTRLDPEAALQRKVPLGSDEGLALQRAAGGESGSGRVIDYRGECTYSAWEHVPSLEWALAVKIDCDEAIAPVRQIRRQTIIWTFAIAALALLAAMLTAHALVKPLNALKKATDRLSKGDFDVRLNINSRDEIGALAESFERMVAAIKFFREHSKSEAEAEAEELALAEEQPPSADAPSGSHRLDPKE